MSVNGMHHKWCSLSHRMEASPINVSRGGVTTSVNGPLKKFDGDDFIVGVGPIETAFKVSAVPHQEDGVWKMTVDGVELSKAQ